MSLAGVAFDVARLPSNVDTFEKLAVYTAQVLQLYYQGITYSDINNNRNPSVQAVMAQSTDGEPNMFLTIVVPMNIDAVTNTLPMYTYAQGEVNIPAPSSAAYFGN